MAFLGRPPCPRGRALLAAAASVAVLAGCASSTDGAESAAPGADASPRTASGDTGSALQSPGGDSTPARHDAGTEPDAGLPHSFTIQFDYDYDTEAVLSTASRRRLLAAAARAWTSRIADDFEAVPAGTALRARDPEHPDQDGMAFELDEPIDDLLLLVGFSTQDGPTGQLGISSHSFTYEVANVALRKRLEQRYFELPFQPWVGSVSFDIETAWFFDATPETAGDIPETESDFMTTAMHEIGHMLGVGSFEHWSDLVENGHFVGEHAMMVHGGPVLLDPDGVHVDESVLSDGKEILMDTQTTVGTRVYPTRLDFAILQDLGYTITPDGP